MGGPGATATAPSPDAVGGAYSEYKIRKSAIGWDGLIPIGFMLVMQCDVQAKGHTMFPTTLGVLADFKDWNYPGWYFPAADGNLTASATTVAPDDADLRPIMAIHAQTTFANDGPQAFAEGILGTTRVYSAVTSDIEDTALYEEVPTVIREREDLT